MYNMLTCIRIAVTDLEPKLRLNGQRLTTTLRLAISLNPCRPRAPHDMTRHDAAARRASLFTPVNGLDLICQVEAVKGGERCAPRDAHDDGPKRPTRAQSMAHVVAVVGLRVTPSDCRQDNAVLGCVMQDA